MENFLNIINEFDLLVLLSYVNDQKALAFIVSVLEFQKFLLDLSECIIEYFFDLIGHDDVDGPEELFEFLVIFLFEVDVHLYDGQDVFEPSMAEIAIRFIELAGISLDVIEDIVRLVLAFLPLLEELYPFAQLLVFLIDLGQTFRVQDMIVL